MAVKKSESKPQINWDRIITGLAILATIVLAFVNYQTSKSLEFYRNQSSVITEYSRMQIEKIGEIWGELNVYEAKVYEITQLLKKYKFNEIDKNAFHLKSDQERLDKLTNSINPDSILYMAERNRFWIDNEQYQIMGDWSLLVARKLEMYFTLDKEGLEAKKDSLEIMDKFIKERRQKLDSVLLRTLEANQSQYQNLRWK